MPSALTSPSLPHKSPQLSSPYEKQHASPEGPGDARPTAMQIIRDNAEAAQSFSDKVILVTGCSSGIGVQTVRALYATGAKLFMMVRDVTKGKEIIDDIVENYPEEFVTDQRQEIEMIEMHMDSLESVRMAAHRVKIRTDKLNVVVNNAGVMASPFTLTKDGFELQFAVNHLAHFLLVQILLPLLLSSSTSAFHTRVINLTSVGHRASTLYLDHLESGKPKSDSYNPFLAYSQSKTANIWFANELNRRYGRQGLHGLAVHPGAIATPIQRHLPQSTIKAWRSPLTERNGKSVEQGAATTVWAVISKYLEGKGSLYLENCKVSSQAPEGVDGMSGIFTEGYANHAFDPAGERRLWSISCEMAGIKDVVCNDSHS